MKINYKKGLVAFSAFLFTTMNTAYAAPQNMQLKTESVLNANGQKIIINSTLWYGGNKVRMENEIAPTKGVPSNLGKSTIIYDSDEKVVYMMMPQNKTAIKADSETLTKMQNQGGVGNVNAQLLTNPSEIRSELKKQGGKMIGAETVLGYLCDIWQMNTSMPINQSGAKEDATVKIWLANKLSVPLRMEIMSKQRGKIVSINAKEINANINIPKSTFEVPAGYQITDVQKMMNQMKKQIPEKK
jgi:outer membrane lipoprotein-sorting protein